MTTHFFDVSDREKLLERGLRVSRRESGGRSLKVIDVGCGDGRSLFSLFENRFLETSDQVVGLDLSPTRINNLKQLPYPIKGVVGGATELPFENSSFDFVICSQVIEHIPDQQKALNELRRILRPQGFLFLSTVLKKSYAWYFYRNSENRWVLDPTHVREYSSKEEVVSLLEVAKFTVVENDQRMFRFPLTDFFVRCLGGDSNAYRRHAFLKRLRSKFQIPIIGYYNIGFLAKRLG